MTFDRIAPFYRAAEFVLAGRTLQRARTRWFDQLTRAKRILIVGEGVGRSLEALLPVATEAQITVVEASGAMIASARRRLKRSRISVERVEWVHADIRVWPGESSSFDAIITPFVLDCFDRKTVGDVVARLAHFASDDARWLHADFSVPPSGWRKWRARTIHWLMYRTFRLVVGLEAVRLTPPDGALQTAGFSRARRSLVCGGLVASELWQREPDKLNDHSFTRHNENGNTKFMGVLYDRLAEPRPVSVAAKLDCD